MNHSQDWINVGYELFAQEGHEGLQVERLARILTLNKSGFYHYFGKGDIFLEHLLLHHHDQIDLLVSDIKSIDHFEPACYQVLIKHANSVMATRQLLSHWPVHSFEQTYHEVTQKINRAMLPIWSAYLGAPYPPEFALRYLRMINHQFYSQISYDRLNVNYLDTFFSNTKTFLEELSQFEIRVNA